MIRLLRLMPLMAGIARSQTRDRVRDVKLGLFVSLALAVGAATAYVGVLAAIVAVLRHSLGLAGAFLATGLGALALALIVAFAFKLYRKRAARNWRRRQQSINGIATTSLALLPLLARRYTMSNPKLAIIIAGGLGLLLATMTSAKSRD
jgi:high-affinity Fe2+/Pb2+ permease